LNRLPIKKINFEKGISFSKINNPSINRALTKFSNDAQTALILPIFAVVGVPHQQPFTCVCLHTNPHFSCSTLAIVLQ
jgi:hypothetical protein